MNLADTKRLCALISAVSPSQRFEPETPEVWHPLLEDLALGDALKAAQTLAMRQPYISPADIREAVRALRADRLQRIRPPAPNVDPDDPAAQQREQLLIRDAIASGEWTEADVQRYEQGGWNLLGVEPHYALGSAMVTRPAIAAAFGSLFRDARGANRIPRGRLVKTLAEVEVEQGDPAKADRLAAARARLDSEIDS